IPGAAARTAPARTAVVRVVRARVAVTEGTAGRGADRARPGAGDVVVRRSDHAARVVRVDGDRGLVLRRAGRVLVHENVRRGEARSVERARQDEAGRDRRPEDAGVLFPG